QEGSLCAQHCLNNLLQGEYFSPVELSSIAHQLDEEERMRMAEGGVQSVEYQTFLEVHNIHKCTTDSRLLPACLTQRCALYLQQPSGNMDDSGFFSIQVISNALSVWGLEIILFNSREYQMLRIDPIHEKAFICNYKEHWFTVRKLGRQLISDTYLALFLAQLQQEGYSIFVVRGNLPECEADEILKFLRVEQQQRPKLIGEERPTVAAQPSDVTHTPTTVLLDEDEEELRKVLELSRKDLEQEDEEADLRRAIQLSMSSSSEAGSSSAADSVNSENQMLSPEELRRRRQEYFTRCLPRHKHFTGARECACNHSHVEVCVRVCVITMWSPHRQQQQQETKDSST
ncbi:hypothetical protein DNTS_008908, partial [Danionella cerebrum]